MGRSGITSLGVLVVAAALLIGVSAKKLILVCGPARFAILSNGPPYLVLILQARIRRTQNQAVNAGVPYHDICDDLALVDALMQVRVEAQVQDR